MLGSIVPAAPSGKDNLEVVFTLDPSVDDGRYAVNMASGVSGSHDE